ncbi:MAG: hydroxyacid dehydrogenase [Capsulimonadaceae bacterium]|nr:hydroxyacid dehydrogenase [Capsulimonadaceae bacterium]
MPTLNAALVATPEMIDYVYGAGRRDEIARRTNLFPDFVSPAQLLEAPDCLHDVDVIFSTWSMPALESRHLDLMPRLKAVFYAAGSVQYFARPLLLRGITVVSGWRANAIPVAEFTLAQIILATKGYFRNVAAYDGGRETQRSAFRGAGAYGETVALLGAGAIGTHVVELLKPFQVKVIVFDPFLTHERAAQMGVEKVETLAEAFDRGYVVSNHLANNPKTVRLISREVLERLRPNATFINTGRGATVDEVALADILERRKDVTALLDVTDPEPPGADSRLAKLPNVHLSTHIAGGINDEVHRLADYCIAELDRMIAGQPLQHAVTLEALERLA